MSPNSGSFRVYHLLKIDIPSTFCIPVALPIPNADFCFEMQKFGRIGKKNLHI